MCHTAPKEATRSLKLRACFPGLRFQLVQCARWLHLSEYRGHLSDHNIVTQTSPVVAYSRTHSTHAYMHHLLLHKSLRYNNVSKRAGQKTRRPSTKTPQRHTETQHGRKLLIIQTAAVIWKCKAESAHLSFRGLEAHPPYQVSRMRSNPCVGKHRPSWHGEGPAVALRLLHDCIPWQRPGSLHSSKLQPQLLHQEPCRVPLQSVACCAGVTAATQRAAQPAAVSALCTHAPGISTVKAERYQLWQLRALQL